MPLFETYQMKSDSNITAPPGSVHNALISMFFENIRASKDQDTGFPKLYKLP